MNKTEKRLFKEYVNIQKEFKSINSSLVESGILSLAPVSEDDIYQWRAEMKGPKNTPYQEGTWDMAIEVSPTYPMSPPRVKFITERKSKPVSGISKCSTMPHPNVDLKTGEVCLDILQNQWTPVWTLSSCMTAMSTLLANPEPDSPLNIDLANLLRCGDVRGYNSLIKYYIRSS